MGLVRLWLSGTPNAHANKKQKPKKENVIDAEFKEVDEPSSND
jgi:hypothetical protein